MPLSFAPMPRRPSRLFVALLWLAIALLPLRGVAAAWMHGTTTAPSAVAAHDESHPCHGGSWDGADADASATDVHQGCQLCDICNGSVAAAPEAMTPTQAFAAAPPPVRVIAPRGRTGPDGLYRPPR